MPQNDNDEQVTISLDGAGLTFKSKISPLTATNVIKLCVATEQANKGLPAPAADHQEFLGESTRISLGEYVNKYQPTTYPQKILAIASYLKEIKHQESFSPDDVRPLFRTIGEVPPQNFGRDFRLAVSNSWVASEDNNPNAFYITSLGLSALRSNFAGPTIIKRKNRKRSKGSDASVSASESAVG
ncbi:MAG: hypothetical protein PHI63_05425 [Patescibacteria group bacterium]|nr:hypothetical protein [Patescibacteria group bacterium]